MQIYPAIDLIGGRCVRLTQGDFNRKTEFDEDPVARALSFAECGASFLHVVDLDGARKGSDENGKTIGAIIAALQNHGYSLTVQTGGGIRTMDGIKSKLELGVSRVILGSAAADNTGLVSEAAKSFGNKIAVGIDARNGMVATHGWEKTSTLTAVDFCKTMESFGVQTVIYTDIAKDGMMLGPNLEETSKIVNAVKINIIASGGISCFEDLENVRQTGASGVIVGKAVYLGKLDLRQAIRYFQK